MTYLPSFLLDETGSTHPSREDMIQRLGEDVMVGYHCEDRDGDGCPNGCEAMFGTDPLDDTEFPPAGRAAACEAFEIGCGGARADLCGAM